MKAQLRRLLFISSISLTFFLLIVIVNQILQFSNSISQINPFAGSLFLIITLIVLAVSIFLPIIVFVRLPSPLIPPQKSVGKSYEKHMRLLSKRLKKNPNVPATINISDTLEGINEAITHLNALSTEKIKKTSKRAFFTTAISQNGALDALFILALQFKLVWDIAHIYSQRPTLKDLSFLYSNVFATALIASQLDEAEYFEMIESAISTGVGSAISFVPGTSIIVNSALSGSSNAFLTLRVGIITQEYCSSVVRPKRITVRNSATAKAAKMLFSITSHGTKELISFMGTAPFKKVYRFSSEVGGKFKDFGSSIFKKEASSDDKNGDK